MGKGSRPRPRGITSAEYDLRWDLLSGRITMRTYLRRFKKLKEKGLVQRNGKAVK